MATDASFGVIFLSPKNEYPNSAWMTQDTQEANFTATGTIARILESATRLATSWMGLTTAYLAAIATVGIAWQKLPDPLKVLDPWLRATVIFSLPALLLIFHGLPALRDRIRRKQLSQITGKLAAGYFTLKPREKTESYSRPDDEHQEVLKWLECHQGVLYLTGLSGTGKSSLLNAYVLPRLSEERNTCIIRLRGYQAPLTALRHELLQPSLIWKTEPAEVDAMRPLLERACRHLGPRRLVVVFDQFEEFVILKNEDEQKEFSQFLRSLSDDPIDGLTALLVCRSDYIGLVEKHALPLLVQDSNWKEIPPFTERAAQDFLQGSGLQMDECLLRDILREASELERTRGLIRPITINLCGLVIGRFATGFQGSFRPGSLIRGFIAESISLPGVEDVAPHIVPCLITGHVTKLPRTTAELTENTGIDRGTILICLRRLGQNDRSLVRSLDEKQELWEISHDFLVPLLDSVVAHWRASFWKKFRNWLPWITVGGLVLVLGLLSNFHTDPRDPISELSKLGWSIEPTKEGLHLAINVPPKGSHSVLQLITRPIFVRLREIDPSIAEWRDLKSLTALDLSSAKVSDVGPLKELKSLTTLDLSYTHVRDMGPLKELKSLTTLDLNGTQVSDVEALKELKSLTTLDLSNTPVSDVEALKELKSLTTLKLGFTQVKDLSKLKGLKSLTTLDLHGIDVSDVGPLKELKNLTTLDLGGTDVRDVGPLKELKNLTTLDLSYTNVRDVGPLKELKRLTTLDLSDARAIDASSLKELRTLTTLNLRSTQVSDVGALKELRTLTKLDLSFTQVSDVGALKELKSLTTLDLANTKVSDVGALQELKSLTTLKLSWTQVSDVAPLKELKSLTALDLDLTRVSNVEPLQELKSLITLNLGWTEVSDVAPLKELKSLTVLNLRHTHVSDANISDLKNRLPRLQISR